MPETLYLIRARCPCCGAVANLVERTETPVLLDQDVAITTRWCPECGDHVGVGEWDRHEETEIERVAPTPESRGEADA